MSQGNREAQPHISIHTKQYGRAGRRREGRGDNTFFAPAGGNARAASADLRVCDILG